jgi:SAM-dependent methyltransferase
VQDYPITLTRELSALVEQNKNFLRGMAHPPELRIAPGDGMLHEGQGKEYLKLGRGAVDLIVTILRHRGVSIGNVKSVLDFAAGFGRVTRWLAAAFPKAQLVVADTDKRAMSASRELFGVKAVDLERVAPPAILGSFDVIWVGSLFTHLPETVARETLIFLRSQLAPGGTLVFTTHGDYVAQRIRAREKIYNLDEDGCRSLLDSYETTGFGFAAYPGRSGYGIAVSGPGSVLSLCDKAGLTPLHFIARGWGGHQDVWGAAVN